VNALCAWFVAHSTSCAEVAGALILVVNVYLVTRENIWNWPVAIVGSAFYIVVFLRQGLYSDTGLQVVYIVLSVYGWYHWLHGGANRSELPVTRASLREWATFIAAGAGGWAALFFIVSRLPGTALPALDSALTATSLVAQYMMTRKLLENWALWIVVDVAYVGMFIYKGLNVTALLYAIFLGLAILGHVEWKRSIRRVSPALS
jgi:nicotinamide mononucleotide transporter